MNTSELYVPDKNDGDLISREAAIEAIEELKTRYLDRKVILAKAQDAVMSVPTYDCTQCFLWEGDEDE